MGVWKRRGGDTGEHLTGSVYGSLEKEGRTTTAAESDQG